MMMIFFAYLIDLTVNRRCDSYKYCSLQGSQWITASKLYRQKL